MSVQVIHTCDRCKRQGSEEEIQLRGVFVRVNTNLHDYGGGTAVHTLTAQWCDNCVREFGLWPHNSNCKGPAPIDPPPTLEDLIREICREEARQ